MVAALAISWGRKNEVLCQSVSKLCIIICCASLFHNRWDLIGPFMEYFRGTEMTKKELIL